MKGKKYFKNIDEVNGGKYIYIIPSNIQGRKKDFLEVLYYVLELPTYFGFNFDSLEEILGDAKWHLHRNITFFHNGFANDFPLDTFKTYISILKNIQKKNRKFSFYFDENISPVYKEFLIKDM